MFQFGFERSEIGPAHDMWIRAPKETPEHATEGDPGDPPDVWTTGGVTEQGQQRRGRD
jgi:hypothetical protein